MTLKDDIVSILKAFTVELTFYKVDGSLRKMFCTLNESYIPGSFSKESKRKDNPDIITVFDLYKEDWRSFKVDNLLSMNIDFLVFNDRKE